MAPAKSACPGRGLVTGLRLSSAPSTSSTGSACVQFCQSLLRIRIATGETIVCECRTPATISARSVSIFIRPPRPYPCSLRHSSRLTASKEIGIPAGSPVSVATRHSPWDSPAVSKRNIWQDFYPSRVELFPAFLRKKRLIGGGVGEVSTVADSVCLVLAAGAGSAGFLSRGVAPAAAVSHRGNRCRGRLGFGVGAGHFARQAPAGPLIPCCQRPLPCDSISPAGP